MQRNVAMSKPPVSSFLSCEKDTETILKKLFIEARPYSDILKRLLVIQNKDCMDKLYDVSEYSLARLREDGYIILEPRLEFEEHEKVKSYIVINFDNFIPNSNPEFRDCQVNFHIVCHSEYWDIGNYRMRPLKIAGYIDGILNNSRLSGIGTFQFIGCSALVLNDVLSGYTLSYWAVHGSDDQIPNEE